MSYKSRPVHIFLLLRLHVMCTDVGGQWAGQIVLPQPVCGKYSLIYLLFFRIACSSPDSAVRFPRSVFWDHWGSSIRAAGCDKQFMHGDSRCRQLGPQHFEDEKCPSRFWTTVSPTNGKYYKTDLNVQAPSKGIIIHSMIWRIIGLLLIML